MALLSPGNRFLLRIALLALVAVLLGVACNTPDLVGNFGIDASLDAGGAGPTTGAAGTGGSPDGGP